MKFEYKAVVIPSGPSDKLQESVQDVLDKHRDWRLVSAAAKGYDFVLCFARDV
jgi:hypothetical protein